MSGPDNWRIPVDAGDYFSHQKKKIEFDNRRPVVRRASDIVGPGIAPTAVRITNYNDLLATYNGFFSSAPGAHNAPEETGTYIGTVVSDAELGGVQTFTDITSETRYQRAFRRNPSDAATIYWGAWVAL